MIDDLDELNGTFEQKKALRYGKIDLDTYNKYNGQKLQ